MGFTGQQESIWVEKWSDYMPIFNIKWVNYVAVRRTKFYLEVSNIIFSITWWPELGENWTGNIVVEIGFLFQWHIQRASSLVSIETGFLIPPSGVLSQICIIFLKKWNKMVPCFSFNQTNLPWTFKVMIYLRNQRVPNIFSFLLTGNGLIGS